MKKLNIDIKKIKRLFSSIEENTGFSKEEQLSYRGQVADSKRRLIGVLFTLLYLFGRKTLQFGAVSLPLGLLAGLISLMTLYMLLRKIGNSLRYAKSFRTIQKEKYFSEMYQTLQTINIGLTGLGIAVLLFGETCWGTFVLAGLFFTFAYLYHVLVVVKFRLRYRVWVLHRSK